MSLLGWSVSGLSFLLKEKLVQTHICVWGVRPFRLYCSTGKYGWSLIVQVFVFCEAALTTRFLQVQVTHTNYLASVTPRFFCSFCEEIVLASCVANLPFGFCELLWTHYLLLRNLNFPLKCRWHVAVAVLPVHCWLKIKDPSVRHLFDEVM